MIGWVDARVSDRFFYVPELLLRPREPGCGETLVSLVSAEPGCHRLFASREPGPSIGPGNQSRASRMKGAWLRCIRATNQALTDPCAAGGRSHGRGGGNKRRRGGMGLPESGSRRRCAACHCADALVRLELGLGHNLVVLVMQIYPRLAVCMAQNLQVRPMLFHLVRK